MFLMCESLLLDVGDKFFEMKGFLLDIEVRFCRNMFLSEPDGPPFRSTNGQLYTTALSCSDSFLQF